MDNPALMTLIMYIAFWLVGFIIGLWILWAIIRGAVLSALRKHSYEQAEEAREAARTRV